ncbi:hypothetical protein CEUSTIGMA_g8115.t1 [Chlamydomonas eustigma]|uniref:Protein kinase domain-containing protein n=1 Tax=Chlamydomonas eustigma TaxID=1157962 RepID=A0A250XD48_9CHLO|nr:hypothetical protein CEUSTIGMA_g8115.t1 [Chlamydomonas eustigma]|eukprot:GAX80680.1 hypothetical protein CEUSTIGMA_g8115.t1 [Chlamydomonas eustigma]
MTEPDMIHAITASTGIVVGHPIFITDGEQRTICVSSTLPPAMQRSSTWKLEDFDLHKELYRGKSSLLYMATEKKSGMQIALKLYRKKKLSTLNRYQVEREIRIHINMEHENIIRLYAAFEDEKNVYMVQEFAGGGDLFEDLKRNGGQVKERQAVKGVIQPFLSSLVYMHSKTIIHRDIKPENILLSSSKVIKVADFGLSIDCSLERPVTRAGTLDYMVRWIVDDVVAPEVLICPDKRRPEENKDKELLAYTPQVDAWAVGILAYEILVGYPPFEQESRAQTYEMIMYKEPKFPVNMSQEAKSFISMALIKVSSCQEANSFMSTALIKVRSCQEANSFISTALIKVRSCHEANSFISMALIKNATNRSTIADLARHPWILSHSSSASASTTVAVPPQVSRVHSQHYSAQQASSAASATSSATPAPAAGGSPALATASAAPSSSTTAGSTISAASSTVKKRSSRHNAATVSSSGVNSPSTPTFPAEPLSPKSPMPPSSSMSRHNPSGETSVPSHAHTPSSPHAPTISGTLQHAPSSTLMRGESGRLPSYDTAASTGPFNTSSTHTGHTYSSPRATQPTPLTITSPTTKSPRNLASSSPTASSLLTQELPLPSQVSYSTTSTSPLPSRLKSSSGVSQYTMTPLQVSANNNPVLPASTSSPGSLYVPSLVPRSANSSLCRNAPSPILVVGAAAAGGTVSNTGTAKSSMSGAATEDEDLDASYTEDELRGFNQKFLLQQPSQAAMPVGAASSSNYSASGGAHHGQHRSQQLPVTTRLAQGGPASPPSSTPQKSPLAGVLSDDSLMVDRSGSITALHRPISFSRVSGNALALGIAAPASPSAALMQRLRVADFDDSGRGVHQVSSPSGKSSTALAGATGSKYSKIFSKMWGGVTNGSSVGALVLREDSVSSPAARVESMSRPLGMNSVEFKSGSHARSGRAARHVELKVSEVAAGGFVGRLNSEGVLTRPVFTSAEVPGGSSSSSSGALGAVSFGILTAGERTTGGGNSSAAHLSILSGNGAGSSSTAGGEHVFGGVGVSGRSFTSSYKQPGASRIAQGAMVSKIEAYVTQRQQQRKQQQQQYADSSI